MPGEETLTLSLYTHLWTVRCISCCHNNACASQHWHLNCGLLCCDLFSQECAFMMLYAHITTKDKMLHVTWLETCLRETKRVHDREQVVSFRYIKISMSESSMCGWFSSAGCWQACSHTVPSSRPSAPNSPSENTWDIKQKSSPQVSVSKISERCFIDKID